MVSGMFHEDGCVRANIRVNTYRVTVAGKCEHTKVIAAQIVLEAETPESAAYYVSTMVRIPQTAVISIEKIEPTERVVAVVPAEISR